jgi:hypothetical protein
MYITLSAILRAPNAAISGEVISNCSQVSNVRALPFVNQTTFRTLRNS